MPYGEIDDGKGWVVVSLNPDRIGSLVLRSLFFVEASRGGKGGARCLGREFWDVGLVCVVLEWIKGRSGPNPGGADWR